MKTPGHLSCRISHILDRFVLRLKDSVHLEFVLCLMWCRELFTIFLVEFLEKSNVNIYAYHLYPEVYLLSSKVWPKKEVCSGAQQIKDLTLPLQWLELLPLGGFDPCPGNFHVGSATVSVYHPMATCNFSYPKMNTPSSSIGYSHSLQEECGLGREQFFTQQLCRWIGGILSYGTLRSVAT